MKDKIAVIQAEELRELFEMEAKRIHDLYTARDQKHISELREKLYMFKEWWSLEETAKELGVSAGTVRKEYVKQGLKYSKVGQKMRFKRDDVWEWHEENRVKRAA